ARAGTGRPPAGRACRSGRRRRAASPGELYGAGFSDHRDLDLARVGELGLEAARDVARQPDRLLVGDLLGVDDDADLAAGLDRERLLHALEARRDLLELLEPLDVGLEDLATGAGA